MNWRQQANGRRAELLLALVTAATLAPFLHRAFDIDEPLFLWMARQIAKHPLDPYGFMANWTSLWLPMWMPMQNPPLCSYYIAAVASIFGWSEIALHAAFLLPGIAAILGTFALARRLCDLPATAALLTLFTPVFLITASSVMCDVMLMACWVWAIELWFRALERNRHWIFASAAALITAATFTKYFGISLVPLLLTYTVIRDRGMRFRLLYLSLPLLAVLVYEGVTKARYGAPLFTSAMIFLRHSSEAAKIPLSTSFLAGCSFLGGCIFSAFFFLRGRRRIVIGGILLCLGTTILFRLFFAGDGAFGNNTIAVQLQGGFFTALGIAILALAFYHMAERRDAETLLLLLWILGGFGFAAFLNWSITARTILPILPAVTILVLRVWQEKSPRPPALPALGWRLACAAAISLFVTYADYQQANTSRGAARHFRQEFGKTGSKVWFQGHWGFQWYMQEWNAEPVTKTAQFLPGDLMIIPSNDADPTSISRESVVSLEQYERHLFPVATTFAPDTGAAFYSNARGPVPWLLGRVPPLRWEVVVFK